jgi:hypothetical protein
MKTRLRNPDLNVFTGSIAMPMNANKDNPLNLEPSQIKELEDLIASLKRDMIGSAASPTMRSNGKSPTESPENSMRQTDKVPA